jgi:exodeoxyribonuclease VII large subunit
VDQRRSVGCTRAASGHFYFTLKDASAQVRCVFFRHKAQGLGFALREGLAVEVRRPDDLRRARRIPAQRRDDAPCRARRTVRRFVQMKTALAAAGLFETARKRSLRRSRGGSASSRPATLQRSGTC